MVSADSSQTQPATGKLGSDAFHTRFVRVGALGIGGVCFLVMLVGISQRDVFAIGGGLAGVLVNGSAYALTYRGGGLLGRRVFVYGMLLNALSGPVLSERGDSRGFGIYVVLATLCTTLAAFTLTRVDLLIAGVGSVGMLLLFLARVVLAEGWHPELASAFVATIGLVLVQVVITSLFTSHSRGNQQQLNAYVDEVDRVMVHARRIAKGDLGGAVEGDTEVSETIRAMLEGLRTMVTRTREAATALSSSAQEIAAMARQQEQGAVEQASAVTQVHKTLARLLEGSSHAAQSTEEVFRNVELTQRTSEVVAQRAAALSAHTRRIAALLEVIKSIANKSEILALNAALEGARAGEAGRGFSLVASQMQRLAESVMDSVRDVRALVEDIEAATSATVAATDESTQLSAKATTAARHISVTLQQQRGSTEQVAAAMHDIQQVTAQVSAGSTQSLSATRDLTRLADELKHAIEGFQL